MSKKENTGLTFSQLVEMEPEELTEEWMKERIKLEAKDPNDLTFYEKRHLALAIIYTTEQ